jgi:type II secretory ATPase GspE/PulE/Tfp pilus assembly ATPase PilB-like protein
MWLKLAGITEHDLRDKVLYKPRGCEYCSGIGFRGRIGVFEMMNMNNEIRTLAVRARPDQQDPQGRPRQRHEEPPRRRPPEDPQRHDDRRRRS